MKLISTEIDGVWVIEGRSTEDDRGAFSRLFCTDELKNSLGQRHIVQINQSRTKHIGTIRGLHYQRPPAAEMKIVRCLKGRVFDVAVDLRQDSSTFLKWTSTELSPEKNKAFVIPEGCAHGFQVLEEDSELLYLHTAFYSPQAEGAVRFDEPKIRISWPLSPSGLSDRDLSHPYLNDNFTGIIL